MRNNDFIAGKFTQQRYAIKCIRSTRWTHKCPCCGNRVGWQPFFGFDPNLMGLSGLINTQAAALIKAIYHE